MCLSVSSGEMRGGGLDVGFFRYWVPGYLTFDITEAFLKFSNKDCINKRAMIHVGFFCPISVVGYLSTL